MNNKIYSNIGPNHPLNLYGRENERLFGNMTRRLEQLVLERVPRFSITQELESLGAVQINIQDFEKYVYFVCQWDGYSALAADKDSYTHFISRDGGTDRRILFPKELALRIVALGYIP